MNEQEAFINRIKEITEIALDQENVIFTSQLESIFPETVDNPEKKQLIVDFLKEKKIGLDEKVDYNDYLNEDEKNYLSIYLEELSEIDKLSKGEREAYTISAMSGDSNAVNIIINDYLSDVVEIAKLYAGQGVLMEDLIGEGNIALLNAVSLLGSLEKPSEAEGFIGKMVMDAMQDAIAAEMDDNSDKEKLVKNVNKVSKAAEELSALLGRKVSIEELSKESGISETMIKKAMKLTANKIDGIEVNE